MEIILIRHGQSEANAGITDHQDSELTELGQRQAIATAAFLKKKLGSGRGWIGIVSPFLRALQTAAPIADALDLSFTANWDVREIGEHDGGYHAENPAVIPDLRSDFHPRIDTHQKGDGKSWDHPRETAAEFATRITAFINKTKHQHKNVIVVSHGSPILMMGEVLRGRSGHCPAWTDQITNASVTWFRGTTELHYSLSDFLPKT